MSQLPNNSIEQLHRQRLAQPAQRAQFERLTSTPSSNSAQYDATTLIDGQRRRTNVGHGLTISSIMAARHQRGTFPQQSAISQSMRRTVSNRSEPAMSSLQTRPMGHSPDRLYAPKNSPAAPRLSSVLEYSAMPDVGMSVDVYLANTRNNEQSYLASTGVYFSHPDIYNNGFAPSAPPSMISASSAAEVPLPMTRENSSFGNHSGVDMARLASFRSQGTDGFSSQDTQVPQDNTVHLDWKNPNPSNDLIAIGINLSPPPAHQQYTFPVENAHLLLSPNSFTMERSDSSASARSTRSTVSTGEHRAKEARERHLQNSRTQIAPRPQQASTSRSPGVVAGNQDARAALNKIRYQRPKHPKVQCTLCDDSPEFRGDHELRRHINAKHEGVVKKFICRDPASVGVPSSLKVLYPLSRCKACSSQKQYGAYYNAAAHLRRTHFRPKPARGKTKVPFDERRGGKGGGDWPAMSELKAWFQEVRVHVDRSGALDADNDAADDEEGIDLDELFSGANGDMGTGFVYDMSFATSAFANADVTMTAPVSAGSMAFEYMAPYNQPTAEFTMISEPNDSTYAAPTNSLTPPSFQGMGQLTASDEIGWEMQDNANPNLAGF